MARELKGLVLSGGKGSRLRPFTYTGAKQLVPVANKPILFYAIEALVEAGIHEIGIVTGDTGDQIREALGDGGRFGARFEFIPQEAPLGIAHAVKIARPFLGDSRFVVFLGDNFLRGGICPFVEAFQRDEADAHILVKPVDDPREFGVVILDDAGKPSRLVEKPAERAAALAIMGIYMFSPRFFEAVEDVLPSRRGELEITDTIQRLIDIGADVRVEVTQDSWVDTGRMGDLLAANRIVLEDLQPCIEDATVEASTLSGRVVVQRGARVVNSVIHGPAIIGEESEIVDSYVGPYTSIYHHSRLVETEIEASVVLENSLIERPGNRIHESLVGRNVTISGASMKPKALRLTLGDFSVVQLP